jgi:hypothetical protein
MADFLIQLVFADIDLEKEEVVEALGEVGVVVAKPLENDLVRLTSVVESHDALSAAHALLLSVVRHLPTASPVCIDRDLVSVTDIADRVGVTREAVRHWSRGLRGPGGFPTPIGTPSGSNTWEWSSVHAWLRHNLRIWDELELPNTHQFSQIDADIERFNVIRRNRSMARAAATMWVSVRPLVSATRLATGHRVLSSRGREHWRESAVEPERRFASVA